MKEIQKKDDKEEEEGTLDDVAGGYIPSGPGCIPIGPVVPEHPDGTDGFLQVPKRNVDA